MNRTRLGIAILMASVYVLGTARLAGAYCITASANPWTSAGTKTLYANPAIPLAIRSSIADALSRWNISGSALVYDPPVFTASWAIYSFRADWVSFASVPLSNTLAGYASGAGTSPSHSGGLLLLNSYWTWVTNGTQDVANHIADTATIVVHELGHFNGLSHQVDCPPVTTAEAASVMVPVLTGQRWLPNIDDFTYQTGAY